MAETEKRACKVCLLPGDGIGPEILAEAVKVLHAIEDRSDLSFSFSEALIGGAAIDDSGTALPEKTLDVARASDAVLLAAVGGPKWDTTDSSAPRPEQGLLGIRKELGLFANLRPAVVHDALIDASTLKADVVRGVDLVIVRELTGGLYFGHRESVEDEPGAGVDGTCGARAVDTLEYREYEIERIARRAFEAARGRSKTLHSIDKANVLDTSRLWRRVVHEVARDYPDVEVIDMLVDNAAMQLIRDPRQFDVLVTENMFGDILSDEASMLTGSLGMLASASLGSGTALFEPSHGSAPDIAGRGIANPLAQILSAAMMLRYGLNAADQADAIEASVEAVLEDGWRTVDLSGDDTPNGKVVGTAAMGDLIVANL